MFTRRHYATLHILVHVPSKCANITDVFRQLSILAGKPISMSEWLQSDDCIRGLSNMEEESFELNDDDTPISCRGLYMHRVMAPMAVASHMEKLNGNGELILSAIQNEIMASMPQIAESSSED